MENDTNETTVTTRYLRPGAVDEAKYAAYVAKTERQFLRHAASGRGDFAGWTPAQCRKAAEDLCAMYRHHFRVLTPASPR